ncbi:mannosyl oligosaccharide glucosidase [Ancylostoma duodenale]|uniref:Mannosyl-oligosaccharide glucosidase n=1 Tax=Ancylostoma duodenale TaxID=51022 RepID=A0A0C2GQK0_9BILA|nr:mannosyl oligosaccharide glucosidase [Ancylostoma duodenale]
MWYEQPDILQKPHMRHWCDQGDGLRGYGWYSADGRTFGRQNVTENYGTLSFDWINHGESWTAKIRANVKTRYTVILYLAAQDRQSKFRIGRHLRDIFSGKTELLGDIRLGVSVKNEKQVLHTTLVWDDQLPLDRLNDLILMNTRALESDRGLVYQLEQEKPFNEGRFVAVQLNFWAAAEMEIAFSTNHHGAKTGAEFEKELVRREQDFNAHFEDSFTLKDKNFSAMEQRMAKVALSNMLGGIGYWHGFNQVQMPGAPMTVPYGPHELLSAVPSRSFFPRGFLWDEGFHNILIRKFDPELSLEIIVSWLNTMSENGWIPREMILGVEAEARVPSEFIVQRTNVANPPSIFYVVDQMLDDEKLLAKHGPILASMYPRLEKWYKWLQRSQAGKKKRTFRWRGRNATTVLELNPKTLASGLDDYPRASHPSKEEYHLDLRCWMALGSRVMNRLAHLYEEDKNKNKYTQEASALADFEDLVNLHWSASSKAFFDYGLHSDKVKLTKKPVKGAPGQSVVNKPRLGFVEDVFGYNSLFPLMLRLIPHEAEHLGHTLDKLVDPEHYGSLTGPYQNKAQDAFTALKKNLVTNMAKEFNRTGYIWENYDDKSGQGRGSHPFNGWSSLILMIMSDNMDV